MYELAAKFTKTQVPRDIRKLSPLPLNTLKFFTFADENLINNAVMDFFAAIPPQRTEDENYAEYKERRIFAKALIKFRPLFYNYSE